MNSTHVDPTLLWVELYDHDDRYLIEGHGYTFPGLFYVRSTADGVGFSIVKGQVRDCSTEAAAWIAGFLAGNAPSLEATFGPEATDDDSDDRYQRWLRAVYVLREEGRWTMEPWSELSPFPPTVTLPPHVWTIRGDEVWNWDRSQWNLERPTPSLVGRTIAGSECDILAKHAMSSPRYTIDSIEYIDDRHLVCERCGYASEVSP